MIGDIHYATGHGIRPICATLRVPRSSYLSSCRAHSHPTLRLRNRRIHQGRLQALPPPLGYREIWQELNDQGIICAPDRVRRLMAERGLRALQPKTFVPRTSDGRADKPSPNRPRR